MEVDSSSYSAFHTAQCVAVFRVTMEGVAPDGGTSFQLGVFGGLPQKNLEISGSEKCILVDRGDGFAMDNGERKNHLRSPDPPTLPLDPPLNVVFALLYHSK